MRQSEYFGLQSDKGKKIVCPYCHKEHGDTDFDPSDHVGLISYHGEEERQEFTCYGCNQIFYVQEYVERTYGSFKSES